MKEKVLSKTKSKLIDMMKCDGEISVEDGANTLDLATTTIRQHLGKLEEQGFVKTRHKRYGRGRPLKMYSLTEESDVWYENTESEVLIGLLEFLEDHGSSELLKQFFEELTEDSRKRFDAFAESRSGTRRELLCEFMKRGGFVPDCEQGDCDGDVVLRFCHCPYRTMAEASSIPCTKEKSFIESALGEKLVRTKHIASGDAVCEYQLADADPES